MSIKKNRKRKSIYLEGHYWATENIKSIQERIYGKNVDLYCLKSPKFSDMPKGGCSKNTLEDKIIDKDGLEKRIDQCRQKIEEIEEIIHSIENQQYVVLLELRYIDYMKLEEVAKIMHLSYSRIIDIHASALDSIEMPA